MIFPSLAFNEDSFDDVLLDLPVACEYAYDIKENNFLLKDGKHYFVYENEAIKIWLYKVMVTIRNRFKAYSSNFGNEFNTLISTTISTEEKKMEVKRFITEAVMVNPYIKSIDRIDLNLIEDELIADVDITTIYGKGGIKNTWSIVKI